MIFQKISVALSMQLFIKIGNQSTELLFSLLMLLAMEGNIMIYLVTISLRGI